MSVFGTLLNNEVKVEPAVVLTLLIVKSLHFGGVGYGDAIIEEDDALAGEESLFVALQFCVDFEFHYFRQLADRQVVWDVESKKEAAYQSLVINNFYIDRLNYNSQQRGMFKPKVFIFNFPLRYKITH